MQGKQERQRHKHPSPMPTSLDDVSVDGKVRATPDLHRDGAVVFDYPCSGPVVAVWTVDGGLEFVELVQWSHSADDGCLLIPIAWRCLLLLRLRLCRMDGFLVDIRRRFVMLLLRIDLIRR
jgi:hypothetical protein